jgi:hypothetical protein
MKPKLKDGEKLNLYLSRDVKRALAELAQGNHRSMSQQVEDMVRRENANSSSASASERAIASRSRASSAAGVPLSPSLKRGAGEPSAHKREQARDVGKGLKNRPVPRGVTPSEPKVAK